MSNKVDKLFKDKLEGHTLPPSAQAWEKLEARLSKKNKTVIWFRVAAVVALTGLLTFVLLQPKDAAVQQPLAQQSDTIIAPKTLAPALAQKEKEVILPMEKKAALTKRKVIPHQKSAPPKIITNNKTEEQSIALTHEEKKTDALPQVAAAPAKKSMKLTFSLPTLESKHEVKEEVVVAAAIEEKKSTLQRAADVAHEIRTGDVLGSLREAKNDLFALEFKKDKSKKQ